MGELQQYKSKPSSLENALKLRYMPSLKLNYSSGAFSRALLHNKKVRTRYFGDETSQIPYTPCPGGQEGLDGQASYTLCQKRNISSKGPEHSRVQFWDSAYPGYHMNSILYEYFYAFHVVTYTLLD